MSRDTAYARQRAADLAQADLHPLRLARHRHGDGLTHAELAALALVSPATIAAIEVGRSPGSPATFSRLARSLNVAPSSLH